jgi:drug/metabolite transporter (DMT)-like permease
MTRAYALDRAARIGATGWMQVVFALVLDRVVIGRTPPVSTLGGIACVVGAGVLLVFDARREQSAIGRATSPRI